MINPEKELNPEIDIQAPITEQLKQNELREISPELIKEIEKASLFEENKVNLLLTYAGLKPASEITELTKTRRLGSQDHFINKTQEEIEQIISLIKKLNIPFKADMVTEPVTFNSSDEESEPEEGEVEYLQILMGHTEQKLKILEDAMESRNKIHTLLEDQQIDIKSQKELWKKNDEELGLSLGFQPTAVQAYVGNKERLNKETLPKEITESEAFLFSQNILSKDYWQEEIKQGQKYADFIKSVSPNIYKGYVDAKKETFILEPDEPSDK